MLCEGSHVTCDCVQEMLERVRGWVKEAGEDCTIEFFGKSNKSPVVSTEVNNPWWRAFTDAADKQ